MTVTEAAEAWDNGHVAVVRRACIENPGLLAALRSYMTPEDHKFLRDRIAIRRALFATA